MDARNFAGKPYLDAWPGRGCVGYGYRQTQNFIYTAHWLNQKIRTNEWQFDLFGSIDGGRLQELSAIRLLD